MNWVIGIVIDIVLLLIVVLCARKGHKDGFAKTLISFLGFFIAIIVAASLCTPLATLTYNSIVAKPVESTVTEFVDNKVEQHGEFDTEALTQTISDVVPGFMRNEENIKKIVNNLSASLPSAAEAVNSAEIAQTVNEKVVMPILLPALTAGAFASIFVILLIVCKILAKSLKLVNKLPLLGGVNAFLGGLLGFLKGIIFVLIINWALVFIVTENGSLFGIITAEALNSSLITKYLTMINPLNIIFSKVFTV